MRGGARAHITQFFSPQEQNRVLAKRHLAFGKGPIGLPPHASSLPVPRLPSVYLEFNCPTAHSCLRRCSNCSFSLPACQTSWSALRAARAAQCTCPPFNPTSCDASSYISFFSAPFVGTAKPCPIFPQEAYLRTPLPTKLHGQVQVPLVQPYWTPRRKRNFQA